MRSTDTIAAIATSLSPSGIGIIRISGSEAIRIADKIYRGSERLVDRPTHTISYGYIFDGNEQLDQVMVMLMRAPRSYTGEDTVEIDCHGGLIILNKILELTVQNGAVHAQPGEFTKRAFLNGKIDLSKAEAVIDIIEAQTEDAAKAGMNKLKGKLYREIKDIRDILKGEIAYIEAALDDPEHYDFLGYDEKLSDSVDTVTGRINTLINNADSGIHLRSGIDTVIIGKPNAGKSSIYNLLAGSERAIVTDIPGTTRDMLREHISLGGIALNLTDTAGLHESNDKVEIIGIERTRAAAENAELIICVLDRSRPISEPDIEILESVRHKKMIILLNKSDLSDTQFDKEDIKKCLKENYEDVTVIDFSASTGQGKKELEKTIVDMFYNGQINNNDNIYISTVRQKNALIQALGYLNYVKASISAGLPEDFYSIDLMNAYEALGQITGESVGDEIIDEIFSRFCMGK